jgi:hypothetical protein
VKKLSLTLCALLAVACSLANAQEVLVTIDPNDFSAGQNLSGATPGAVLRTMSAIANPDPNFPGSFIPQYASGVFAQAVTAGCRAFESVPCSPGGNLVFGYSASTVPSTQPILWGAENAAANCLLICDPNQASQLVLPALRVDFPVPTDLVSAVIAFYDEDGGGLEGFKTLEAFDATGQSVALCADEPPGVPITGCATTVLSSGPDSGWAMFTLARPTADISFILIGGRGNFRPVAQVQFDSPVTTQLAGLAELAQGVGPGKSLEKKIEAAQADFAAHRIHKTCNRLAEFVDEVEDQAGRHLAKKLAARLALDARVIAAAIGCD